MTSQQDSGGSQANEGPSTSVTPDDQYLVGGAALGSTAGATVSDEVSNLYPFSTLRTFQRRVGQWLTEGDTDAPIGVLAAPTGAGKTAAIAAVAKKHTSTLVTYPTNALVKAQSTLLETEHGLSVTVVTGDTLSQHGIARSQELLEYVQDRDTDVVVTNPDVPQAVAQNLYFSPGDRIMEFYAEFDAAVYDEFHFYDSLAATGLLMQIKLITERGQYRTRTFEKRHPQILLSSATPDSGFVDFICEDLPINIGAKVLASAVAPADVGEALTTDSEGISADFIYDILGPIEEVPDWVRGASEAPHPEMTGPKAAVKSLPDSGWDGPSDCEAFDRFRYPMQVNRYGRRLTEQKDFEMVMSRLRTSIGTDGAAGKAAVIFDSAARSNRFYDYLVDQTDALGAGAIKDNGYDTRAAVTEDKDDFTVYVTTSKGEVGLNYDLDRLVMTKPYTATQFIQRIGRAARHSPAVVDVFGLGKQSWPVLQSYPGFLRRVAATLPDPTANQGRLQNIIGLRAAHALQTRHGSGYSEALKQEFDSFSTATAWRATLSELDAALDAEGDGLFGAVYSDRTKTALTGAKAAVEGLAGLRGQSVRADITYPRGEQRVATEYSLTTALRHYRIDAAEDDTLHLAGERADGPVTAEYPGQPFSGDGSDILQPAWKMSEQLAAAYTSAVNHDDLREMADNPLTGDDLEQLLQILPLEALCVPTCVSTPHAEIRINASRGEIETVESYPPKSMEDENGT